MPSYLTTFDKLINSVSRVDVLKDMQKRLEKRVFITTHSIDTKSDLVFVDINRHLDVWKCHEEGEAIRIHWEYKGKPLVTDYIQHGSKHTYTIAYKIMYDGKVWVYSAGSCKGTHKYSGNNPLMLEDIFKIFYEGDTNEYELDKVLDIFGRLFPEGDIMDDEEFRDFLEDNYCCEEDY